MADAALAPPPSFGCPADVVSMQVRAESADLSNLLDAIAGAIHSIEAANTGATAMTDLVRSALALIARTDTADTQAVTVELTAALARLQSQAQTFGAHLSRVQVRQDFAIAMINALPSGAGSRTPVARDREGANLLALQTRQRQSAAALLLAALASQSVLRPFE